MTFPGLLRTPTGWAWLFSFMLIFWAPLPGEQRLPAVCLAILGLWLHMRHPADIAELPGRREMRATLALLVLPCLASLPFSLAPRDTLGILLVLTVFHWVGLAVLSGLATKPPRWLLLALGATLCFWALDALVQLILGVDLLGVPRAQSGRLLGIFGDNQRLGFMLGVMMPLVIVPLARARPYAAMVCYGFLAFIVGMVGSRAAIVFALLAGVVLFHRLPGWRHRLGLLGASLAIVAGAILLSPIHSQRILERNYTTYLDNPAYSRGEALFLQVDDFLSGRLKIWSTAGSMFLARPLTGVGAGAFDEAYDHYSTRPDDQFTTRGGYPGGVYHAHQLYVSAAAETGLVGLACLVAMIVYLVRWYRGLPPEGREHAAPYAYSMLIAFFPINSQHGVYIGWWFMTLFLLLCAMLAAGEHGRAKRTS